MAKYVAIFCLGCCVEWVVMVVAWVMNIRRYGHDIFNFPPSTLPPPPA